MQDLKELKKVETMQNVKSLQKRSKSSSSVIMNTLGIFFDTEVMFLAQIKNFVNVFLDAKTHSLEDMYLHQIEIPEARKLVGFDAHSSLLCMIFNNIIEQTETTITLIQKILSQTSSSQKSSNPRISVRELCLHLESKTSNIFRAAYLCWEWILQAIDFWKSSESNFSARLPDFVEKFIYHQPDIQKVVDQLLSTFYKDLSSISDTFEPITKLALIFRFFQFDSVLENIFTLPLIRSLNYSHILKIFEAETPAGHIDHFSILKAQKAFSIIVRPIFKRVKEFNKLEETSKELPSHLQESVRSGNLFISNNFPN